MLPQSPNDIEVVLYHASCTDGFGAAWAAWERLGDRAVYIPMAYHDPLPEIVRGKNVAVVDFHCEKQDQHAELLHLARSVIILDHHSSAQKKLHADPHAVFDMNKSGAVLAWEYFHPGKPLPVLLSYVQDVDLHAKKIANSSAFVVALYETIPMDFQAWHQIHVEMAHREWELISRGRAIQSLMSNLVDQAVQGAVLITFEGVRMWCVNHTSRFYSSVGNALCERIVEGEETPVGVGMVWWWDASKRRFKVSLRSKSLVINHIASKYGGGGHDFAASFYLEDITSFFARGSC